MRCIVQQCLPSTHRTHLTATDFACTLGNRVLEGRSQEQEGADGQGHNDDFGVRAPVSDAKREAGAENVQSEHVT
jgi:hypothetical protein